MQAMQQIIFCCRLFRWSTLRSSSSCRLFLFLLQAAFIGYRVVEKAFSLGLLLLNNSSLLSFASHLEVEEVASVFNLLRVQRWILIAF